MGYLIIAVTDTQYRYAGMIDAHLFVIGLLFGIICNLIDSGFGIASDSGLNYNSPKLLHQKPEKALQNFGTPLSSCSMLLCSVFGIALQKMC